MIKNGMLIAKYCLDVGVGRNETRIIASPIIA